MKKKEKFYEPSDQDMKDAWFIWITVRGTRAENAEELDDFFEIYNDFKIGLRMLLDRPIARDSAGDLIMKRLYESWEHKSQWADDAVKKMKKGEIDIYEAYSQAVLQTILITGEYKESKKEEFYEQRFREIEHVEKSYKEWNKIFENQEEDIL